MSREQFTRVRLNLVKESLVRVVVEQPGIHSVKKLHGWYGVNAALVPKKWKHFTWVRVGVKFYEQLGKIRILYSVC